MISLEHVGLRYNSGPEVLSDVSCTLETGAFRFITGPSGAGKTSLMRLLYLDRHPTRGLMHMFGVHVNRLTRAERVRIRRRIGVVFQDFSLLPNLNLFDNVALPLRIANAAEPDIRKNVNELLTWVGLGDYAKARPRTLSGGQQQRAAVARAVIARPQILLADEPTGNLDEPLGYRLMHLFTQLNKMGTTVLIATHSESLMTRFPYPRLVLSNGTLEEPEIFKSANQTS